MAKELTQAELIALGKKVVEQSEKAKNRGKARGAAITRLIAAHQPEFNTFLEEEKRKLGIT